MLRTHEREKLLNAIIYFAENTKYCYKVKLFKLLFLLDFEHFKQTGRSVTGLDYYAWPKGPLPADLDVELDDEDPAEDFAQALKVECEQLDNFPFPRFTFVPQRTFDSKNFSTRELRLLEQIANDYKTKRAPQMIEITHAENGVWDKVYAGGAGRYAPIPYELAVEGENSASILERAKEFSAIKQHYAS